MEQYGECEKCGRRDILHEAYDAPSRGYVTLCEDDYRERMRPDIANQVLPPGLARLNARLAKVELDDTLPPTDMEKYLAGREQRKEDLVIAERLKRFEEKFGDDAD